MNRAAACDAIGIAGLIQMYQPDALTDYLEEIRQKCRYRRWFFGHYHDNRNVTERDLMLYEQIIRIR